MMGLMVLFSCLLLFATAGSGCAKQLWNQAARAHLVQCACTAVRVARAIGDGSMLATL